jgi:uncharacterized membrane protein YdbT with pleckstrin-like domain
MRASILRFLRVPHDPEPPVGDEDVRVFRAAPAFMLYRLAEWAFRNAAAGLGVWVGLMFAVGFRNAIPDTIPMGGGSVSGGWIRGVLTFFEVVAVSTYIAQAAFGLLLVRLDFENRWYMVSNRSLRIREGLVRMKELTMTFANVQHVGIRQGPLQRILGIADVEVRTAGGASAPSQKHATDTTHTAYFRGIRDAKLVSDVIRERLRLHRDAGLGDPDDVMAVVPQGSMAEAATALAREAAALRRALAPQG